MIGKRIGAVLAAGALALGLAACGNNSNQAAPQQSGELSGKIQFQTWSLKTKFGEPIQRYIDGFTQQHPQVQIEWLDQPGEGYEDKVMSQATSDQLPDVINLGDNLTYNLAKANLVTNVADGANLGQTYTPGSLAAYTFAGLDGTLAYPWYQQTELNYFNKDLFSQNGLDPNNLPKNMDELFQQGQVMHDNSGGKAFLVSRTPDLTEMNLVKNIPLINSDGTKVAFNTPQAVDYVQQYVDAYGKGLMPPDVLNDTYVGNSKLYSQGTIGWTTATGNFISGTLEKDAPSLVAPTAPQPAWGTPVLYPQALAVSSKSQNPAVAKAFAEYVTNADNQLDFAKAAPGVVPSTQDSLSDPYFSTSDGSNDGDARVIAAKGMSSAKPGKPAQFTDSMNTIFKQQMADALTGKVSAKQALDNAEQQMNQILANN